MRESYAIPEFAAFRRRGHSLAASRAKLDQLIPPLCATGVPLGGIGTGGITRGSDGRFSRWTIKAGGIRQFTMPANGFVLRVQRGNRLPSARALQPRPESDELGGFAFEAVAPEWGGLFPFAWHRHVPLDEVVAECLSFSPVIPGDLACSALPVAVFRWRIANRGSDLAEASLAFHFANLNGWFAGFGEGRPGRVAAGCCNRSMGSSLASGLILDRRRVSKVPPEGTGEWAIALAGEGATLAETVCFDGTGDGSEFWEPFLWTGDAPDLGAGWVSESGFRETPPAHPAAAASCRVSLEPGEAKEIKAVLVWDLPVLTFGQGRSWFRRYTDDWGRDGRNSRSLAEFALRSVGDWEERIAAWHRETAAALGDAPHRAGMAINESYFLVDGLSVLTSRKSPGARPRFGIIECPEYALYNSLDLWVYAAEGVSRFFPELAAGVAEDYANQLLDVDRDKRRHRWDGSLFPLNPAGTAPHDLGGPGEDPFVSANSYTYRNSAIWKDLNCYLVLCIWREGRSMGSVWRRGLFPAVRAAIDHLQKYDRDGDGLIENDGIPDQTFDNIPMNGPSSYCGGLWIAALLAAAALAREEGEALLADHWTAQARLASEALLGLLFNGSWFRVDTQGVLSEACFIEQLLGPFLARRLGLGDIVPESVARKALASIYENNFLDAGGGEGAVSISRIPPAASTCLPHQDDTSFQTSEIQPGFNFSLAAQLESWGLGAEAEQLRRALQRELYERRNLIYQTPAAFDRGGQTCRAIMNMRPLSVWWMS